ncbi:MAG: TIR domain-containing protein [Gammaproteobacteria bacterium]|nr:TIR domain-containing protein [Gammaproteobacteria bacterium]
MPDTAPQGILPEPHKIKQALMGEESPKQASAPQAAVFLSYASQDSEAARRICAALCAGGIEVWFDKSELRGGDAWDRQIRQQIHDCRLFIPIISAATEARSEGYFRREWKLAVDRTHDMSERKAFIVPTVIDDTADAQADVPDAFRAIQWTRLPAGATPPGFVAHVRQLLARELERSPQRSRPPAAGASARPLRSTPIWAALAVLAIAVIAYVLIEKPWVNPPLPAAFAPPPHSIAVLPFVNMSGDRTQEYFSDGLAEELLNSLAEVNELQVAARTSAFSFKGTSTDIGTIARKLNVGAVLEGSVRRSGNTLRITAQLINAVTGFHLWSHTYDRDLTDVLQLQSEIATAVAGALKVRLLADAVTKIELGGTRNPRAFDAYLRASQLYQESQGNKDGDAIIAGYGEAIRLDPDYALAYAGRSLAFAGQQSGGSDYLERARADARHAIALAPDLADGHLALAVLAEETLDFTAATSEYERAVALAPGNARVLRDYGFFTVSMGKTEPGLAAARRAVRLDPLNFNSHFWLGNSLTAARRYHEAIRAFSDARTLAPNDTWNNGWLGVAYYLSGNLPDALKTCERAADIPELLCAAITYDRLGQREDAEGALVKLRASQGEEGAVSYSWIYAQWGNRNRALDYLEAAVRRRNPWLQFIKTYPLADPLREEPRFQAVVRELKFPD